MREPGEEPGQPVASPKRGGGHRATYAADKKKGGWNVRVVGPTPEKYAGREVPVTMKSGERHMEKLVRLIWTGVDTETGELVALYTFAPKLREDNSQLEF